MPQLKGQMHSWCKWNFQLVKHCFISRIACKGAYWVTKGKGASAVPSESMGAWGWTPQTAFFSFPSLLSSFRMRHCAPPLSGVGAHVHPWRKREKSPLILIRGDSSGLWCFRSFKEVTEVPLSWLPSAEMWLMGLFLLWPITLVSLCNKILGQKWKREVEQEEGAGLTRSQRVGMAFATE